MGDGVSKNAIEKLADARERIAELEAALEAIARKDVCDLPLAWDLVFELQNRASAALAGVSYDEAVAFGADMGRLVGKSK